MNDLSSQTGLNLSVSDGMLVYEKDENGNPLVATETDGDGNTSEIGSQEARDLLTGAIGHEKTAYTAITTGRTNSPEGGTFIRLNGSQIGDMINGSRNVDSRTMGWGMTFMHEICHSVVGGSMSDHRPVGSSTGEVVNRMNIIRQQLNNKGGNYGQRMMYKATSWNQSLVPAYVPFDFDSHSSVLLGVTPPYVSKHIIINHQ